MFVVQPYTFQLRNFNGGIGYGEHFTIMYGGELSTDFVVVRPAKQFHSVYVAFLAWT